MFKVMHSVVDTGWAISSKDDIPELFFNKGFVNDSGIGSEEVFTVSSVEEDSVTEEINCYTVYFYDSEGQHSFVFINLIPIKVLS